MSDLDPRVQRLSTAIAQVLVCLVEIAQAAPAPQEPELPLEEKPRRGPKSKGESAPAAEPTAKAEAATPVSEPSTATEAGSEDTRRDTGPTKSTTAQSADADLPEPTLDDAKALVLKVHGAKGRDAAVALLTSFGALFPEGHIKAGQPNAGALTPDQIAPFCEAAREVLEG